MCKENFATVWILIHFSGLSGFYTHAQKEPSLLWFIPKRLSPWLLWLHTIATFIGCFKGKCIRDIDIFSSCSNLVDWYVLSSNCLFTIVNLWNRKCSVCTRSTICSSIKSVIFLIGSYSASCIGIKRPGFFCINDNFICSCHGSEDYH